MLERLLQLFILFTVIFDPFSSFTVFFIATKNFSKHEKNKTAGIAIGVALLLSVIVLIFGQQVLDLFSVDLRDFRIAGGIILGILGVKMVLGQSLAPPETVKDNSSRAIAAIIATPLLTGPAAITAIIVSVHDFGILITGIAVLLVLAMTGLFFLFSGRLHKYLGTTSIQVLSTILGLITLAWGVSYVRIGII